MTMKNYIVDFPNHIKNAMKIGESCILKKNNQKINKILICGLGGSGIGGTILNDLISDSVSMPIIITKDYSVPFFVDNTTLVIASSYSGNTEETISALNKCKKKNAEICIITSGGKLKNIAEKEGYNIILIPSGHPPRAMFGYSFIQLFYILSHYNIITDSFKSDFKSSILLLNSEKDKISQLAKKLAKKLFGTTPVIYVAKNFEGVAIRFRQQLNENAKMLCWHHVVPEMNHNELLGWRTNTKGLSVVYFRNELDYARNQIRIDINKKILSSFTNNINEVWSRGDNIIENTLYHIHYGDWVSWYLSEMNCVDAIEIDVITHLKDELGKV